MALVPTRHVTQGKKDGREGGRKEQKRIKLARTCTTALVRNRPPSTPLMLEIWKKLCRGCTLCCGASCTCWTGATARREAWERVGRAKKRISPGHVCIGNLLKFEKSMVVMTGMLPVASE
jgi:hypothetical protein